MRITEILQILSDSTRLRMLRLLEQEELSVAELQEILEMGQSRISSHLALLRRHGMVSDRKEGKKTFVKMGSYGIGVSRLVAAIIEAKYNDDKMKWPISVAPFHVVIITSINKNDDSNIKKAKKIYNDLKKNGIDVLLDDVEENISNKFKKHDLIGIPYQIIIGSKATEDSFEFKEIGKNSEMFNLNKIIKLLKN